MQIVDLSGAYRPRGYVCPVMGARALLNHFANMLPRKCYCWGLCVGQRAVLGCVQLSGEPGEGLHGTIRLGATGKALMDDAGKLSVGA